MILHYSAVLGIYLKALHLLLFTFFIRFLTCFYYFYAF